MQKWYWYLYRYYFIDITFAALSEIVRHKSMNIVDCKGISRIMMQSRRDEIYE